jgi:pre-60S factor REI1
MMEEDHQCIFCGRYFSSYYACRQHMVDSHHSRIGSENEEIMEILEPFYDYRTSIQEYKFKSKVKMEKVRRFLESVTNEDAQRALQQHLTKLLLEEGEDEIIESDGEEGEDWEYLSDEEVDDQELIRMAELPEDTEVVQCETEDEFAKIMQELGLKPASITDTGDLCLPSGKTVVHREMAYIYKQKGTAARAKRAELAAKNQLMLGDGDKTKLNAGYANNARAMMKKELSRNPFLKVATRAAKRDQKAVIAVLKRQQRDINKLWVQGAANGNIFKRRMDANMPHLLK